MGTDFSDYLDKSISNTAFGVLATSFNVMQSKFHSRKLLLDEVLFISTRQLMYPFNTVQAIAPQSQFRVLQCVNAWICLKFPPESSLGLGHLGCSGTSVQDLMWILWSILRNFAEMLFFPQISMYNLNALSSRYVASGTFTVFMNFWSKVYCPFYEIL